MSKEIEAIIVTLVDDDIKKLIASNVLENAVEENVQSICYDLRTMFYYREDGQQMHTCKLSPNETAFVCCSEKINLPGNIIARIFLRNSRVRQGLQLDSPIYQPGHSTQVFFRITNITKTVITLTTADELALVMFEQLSNQPKSVYNGTFQNELVFDGMSQYASRLSKESSVAMANIFVLMPFTELWSNDMYDLIKQAGFKSNMAVSRADDIYGITPVISDIARQIKQSSVIIAVMTGGNKNVNYELGLAHAWSKPSIMIANTIDEIPFDYKHLRVIIYNERKPDWGSTLVATLVRTLETLINERTLSYSYFDRW